MDPPCASGTAKTQTDVNYDVENCGDCVDGSVELDVVAGSLPEVLAPVRTPEEVSTVGVNEPLPAEFLFPDIDRVCEAGNCSDRAGVAVLPFADGLQKELLQCLGDNLIKLQGSNVSMKDNEIKRLLLMAAAQVCIAVQKALVTFPGLSFESSKLLPCAMQKIRRCIDAEDEDQELNVVFLALSQTLNVIAADMALNEARRVKPKGTAWFDEFLDKETDDVKWLANLRMSKTTFEWLCDQLQPYIDRQVTNWKRPVPLKWRVGAGLYRMVTGADLTETGMKFGIGMTTAHGAVKETIRAINRTLGRYLKWPEGDEMQTVVKGFENACTLPNCFGAIGSTHIIISKPRSPGAEVYYNNQLYSIVLQAVCDARRRFTDVYSGYPGSAHKSTILRNSGFYCKAQEGKILNEQPQPPPVHQVVDNGVFNKPHPYVLGDGGYPLLPWLMVPFRQADASYQYNFSHVQYNQQHEQGRRFVDEAFALLKDSFAILSKTVNQKVQFIPEVVNACCILHNLLLESGRDLDPEQVLQHCRLERCSNVDSEEVVHILNGEEGGEDVRKRVVFGGVKVWLGS